MPPTSPPPLARYGFFLTASQVVQIAVAFGANLVLVRYLQPAEFGRFALAFAAIALIFSVFSFRIFALVIRAPDRSFDDAAKDRYFNASLLETVFSTVAVLIWFTVIDELSGWDIALVAALAARHWLHSIKVFYERDMHYPALTLAETGASILAHSLSVVLIVSGFGLATLYVRELILTTVEFIALGLVGGLTFRRIRLLRWREIRETLLEARGVWIDGIAETGYQRLVLLAAGLFGGTSAAGYFFQANRLATIPHQLLFPTLGRLSSNWIGRGEEQPLQIARRQRFIRLAFPALLALGVAAILWADPVVPWIFGEAWSRSADLVAALCGMITFMTLFEVLKSYCSVTRRMRILLIGRAMQYTGVAAGLVAAWAGWLAGDMALAVGQSIGFFAGFATVLAVLRLVEKRAARRNAAAQDDT